MKRLIIALLSLGLLGYASFGHSAGYEGSSGQVSGAAWSNDGTKTTILPPTGDYLRVGDAGTTSHALDANDDILVSGELEVDGAAYFDNAIYSNAVCGALPPGETSNCGITYSGSTLTITDEAGSALSATNPCCVGLPGATAGQNGTVAFTSAISSTFGATSDTDGNLFGISEANWANPMPWFIHFCRGSASNYAGLSRNPVRYETGDAAGDMCQEGDTDCDAQGDLFIMTTGLTLASEVDMPCVTVGAIRPTYATAGNAWTVSTLGDTDGIGSDRLAKTFATLWTMPVGQNGAEAGKTFTETDGATDLVFDPTNLTTYRLASTGVVSLQHYHGTQNGTGAGDSTAIRWFGPLVAAGTAGQYYSGSGFAGVNTVYSTALPNIVVGTSYVVPGYVNAAVGGSLTAAAFANTADYLIFNIDYPAF